MIRYGMITATLAGVLCLTSCDVHDALIHHHAGEGQHRDQCESNVNGDRAAFGKTHK